MVRPSTSAALFLALSAISSVSLAHGTEHLAPRHQGRMEIVRRQNNNTAVAGAATSATSLAGINTPAVTSPAVTTPATSVANPLASVVNSLTQGVASDVSSIVDPVTSATSSTDSAATSSSTSSTVTSTSAASSSSQVSVVTATSTLSQSRTLSVLSSTASSSSASSSASAAADSSSKSSSGIGHTTLIIIIVIASCVAGIAAIWTLIRKTKFSPSKRFEAKLEPIDFVPGEKTAYDEVFGAHGRSMSNLSGGAAGMGYAPSIARSDSKSSMRGASEANYAGNGAYNGGSQYHYGAPPAAYGSSQAGYPAEQYTGYSDIQRGQSTRGYQSSNLAYNYDAQARSQSPAYGRY